MSSPSGIFSSHIQLLQSNEDPGPHDGLNDDGGSGVSTTIFVHIADKESETVDSDDEITESDNVFADFGFSQIPRRTISPNFVLLDNKSTVCTFCNKNLLTNICPHPKGRSVEVHTNGGTKKSSFIENAYHFDTVWFNGQLITNIISLAWVTNRYHVTMYSHILTVVHVYLLLGTMNFHEMSNRLYCHDISENKIISDEFTNYTFLNTVAANKAKIYHK